MDSARWSGGTFRLHDVCQPKQWQTIKKSEMTESGYPVYGANGIIGHYHSFNHSESTILIGCRGTCGVVNVSDPNSWVTGNAMALDDLDTSVVDPGFVVHALRADGLRAAVTGTSQPQITQTSLKRIQLPLPPMDEQRRIAAVLDAAEALQAKRRQALGKLDDLVKAVFVDMFGDPRANGKSILGQHVDVITKGTTPTSVGFQFTESGVPFVRVQDLVTGSVAVNRIELFISEATNEALRRSILKPNDVLISIAGTIGRIALVPEDAPTLNCNQAVALVRTDEDLEPAYLAAWLNTAHAQDQMLGSRVTGTISNLSLANIRSLRLPIPTIDLQRRFADAAADVERLRDALTAHSDSLDTLFASLQQRAFRGEL